MELEIQRNNLGREVTIILYDRQPTKETIYGYNGKDIVCTDINDTAAVIPDLTPLLKMPDWLFKKFLKCMADYANAEGVNTEEESFLKGKLEAQTLHLTDMRELNGRLVEMLDTRQDIEITGVASDGTGPTGPP